MARAPRRAAERVGLTPLMGRLAGAALASAMLAGSPAGAQTLTGSELRAEISGNTLSGYNNSGVVFSEYHVPDGRVFGHNNGEMVFEGCWDIKNDAICYYYAKSRRPGTYCWRHDRAGSNGYRIRSTENAVTGVARLVSGNPYNHTDGGRAWVCEGLVSSLARRFRHAQR